VDRVNYCERRTTNVSALEACPELSRVEQADSGRSEPNVYGLVPSVPSCPESKSVKSAMRRVMRADYAPL
jgi:hypothetical protein